MNNYSYTITLHYPPHLHNHSTLPTTPTQSLYTTHHTYTITLHYPPQLHNHSTLLTTPTQSLYTTHHTYIITLHYPPQLHNHSTLPTTATQSVYTTHHSYTIIKFLFIEATVRSRFKKKTYMHQPTEHSSSAEGPSQINKL